MEWYIPITILPGIGMLILSTTGQMMTLSGEIGMLLAKKCDDFQHAISDKKIIQLGRLTKAATLLYTSAACFVLAGIFGAVFPDDMDDYYPKIILLLGVILVLIALGYLIQYSFKTITIRRLQHQHNHDMRE